MSNEKQFKVLVCGDSNLDLHTYCNVERLSPDQPVAVVDVVRTEKTGGMAQNLKRNLEAFGIECDILTNKGWKKVKKNRILDIKTLHHFVRIDESYPFEEIDLKNVNWNKYDFIAISDYLKGTLNEKIIEEIGQKHPLTILDSKRILGNYCNSLKFVKINRREYNASEKFLTKDLKDKIITTLGESGARYKEKLYPVDTVEVKNLAGAGDSFQSGFIYSYLKSNGDIDKSIRFANKVCTLIVQKRGIGVIDKKELKELNKEFNF